MKPYPALWNNLVGDNRLGFLKGRFPRLAEVAAESFATGQDTKVSDLRDFYQTEHVVVEDDKTGIFEAKPAVFKMHYKIEQCHRLAKSHMPDDALYVRIRPDQSFGPADPIDWDKVHQEATSHRRLLVDIPYVYTGKSGIFKLADAFLLGAEEPMSIFASLFSTQMALTEAHKTFFDAPPVLFPHASIGFSTFYNGVAARAFTEARPTGFVEAKILAPAQILALLRQDVGDDSKDQLEQDFIAACQAATATETAVTA